jgi:flagellin
MTSIMTNNAAIAALGILRNIGSQLGAEQNRVSTGMRVASAADNAAYWSISTTMRSDNLAISAVEDALGLGAAKVDTAYVGMTEVSELLGQFKALMVSAYEEGIDKDKVQSELEQIKQQVVSISKSASFSGQNWLDTTGTENPPIPSIVTSYVRDEDNEVSVKKAFLPLNNLALFNADGTGILQAGHVSVVDPGTGVGEIGDIGGLLDTNIYASGRTESYSISFPAPVTFSPSDVVEFDVLIDSGPTYAGDQYHVQITYADVNAALGRSDGLVADASEMADVMYYVRNSQNVPIIGGSSGTTTGPGTTYWHHYNLHSTGNNNGIESSILISNTTSTLPGSETLGLSTAVKSGTIEYAKATIPFAGAFQIGEEEGFQFTMTINGNIDETLNFSRSDVLVALGNSIGNVSSASAFADLLNSKTAPLGVLVTSAGNDIVFNIDTNIHPEKGHKSAFEIYDVEIVDVTISPPPAPPDYGSGTVREGDFLAIDITTSHNRDEYLTRLEGMLKDTISGASTLGALQSRISLQSKFLSVLSDSIEQGIGRLVDADMNEASTRLRALESQQQLAVQALSIANASPDALLQLFR